tara:strand:+ start:263 stop:544 length:282 start_codon:yes stop_codon:yes gene_type:complete
MIEKQPKNELQRFTTLVNPNILSHIKLISYFTNQKLYEVVEKSMTEHISNFEIQNKTSISSIINFQQKFNKEDIKNNLPSENKDENIGKDKKK